MTAPDDEVLMRWSDGELSPEEAARLEAAAASDPVLAERMSALRRLRTAARGAFPVEVDPRDRDLARLITATPATRPSPLSSVGHWLGEAFAPRPAAAWAGLAAAAFVAGLLFGPNLGGEPQGLPVTAEGRLADASLIRVLDTRLAAEGADPGGRAIGLSFQDGQGRWCRTFQARGDGMAGLACREPQGWAVRVLAPLGPETGEVRTAASDTPEPVLLAVDAVIAGESADAAAEARARDEGWR